MSSCLEVVSQGGARLLTSRKQPESQGVSRLAGRSPHQSDTCETTFSHEWRIVGRGLNLQKFDDRSLSFRKASSLRTPKRSLQKFNDWLLSFGTLPQAWIEKFGLD